MKNIDVVKGYLLSLGWEPTEVKERDITKNTDRDFSRKYLKLLLLLIGYVEQTEKSYI